MEALIVSSFLMLKLQWDMGGVILCEHTQAADKELFNLYTSFWTNVFLLFDYCCMQVTVHMHTRIVFVVLPKMVNASRQGTKPNNDNPCLETYVCFTPFIMHCLCYRVTIDVFSACIKAQCSALSAFLFYFRGGTTDSSSSL